MELKWKYRVIAPVLSLAMCGGIAFAQSDDQTSDAVSVMNALEKKYSNITTIQGTFTQERIDNTFGETILSDGHFWLAKPNKLRVEYSKPNESTDLFVDGVAFQYVPKLKQVTMLRYKNANSPQDLNFLLLGFGVKTESIQKVYTIKSISQAPEGQIGVRFTPKNQSEANFKDFKLYIDAQTLIPATFSFVGLDGTNSKATLSRKNLKFDGEINGTRFVPSWPDKTRVVEIE